MEQTNTKAIFTLLFLSFLSLSKAQTDSLKLLFDLYGKAFFDNKEFTGDIKKGYTHTGFVIGPGLTVGAEQFNIKAGFHLLYLAGADSLERFVPILTASVKLNQGITLVAGTLSSKQAHWLPEPLYKPERLLLNQPETGIQFLYHGKKSKADLWINWERYIKVGSPFQEEFTVGFSHLFNTEPRKQGFSNSIHALAFHKGGQIDSTNLPVQTLVNLAVSPSFAFTDVLGFCTSFYLYKNLSPSATLKYNNGYAIHPRVTYSKNNLRFELGQWFSNGFINPRGEELYSSLSTISPAFDTKNRMLTTSSVVYEKTFLNSFALKAFANLYYDAKASTLEYSYTLYLTFDGTVREIKR